MVKSDEKQSSEPLLTLWGDCPQRPHHTSGILIFSYKWSELLTWWKCQYLDTTRFCVHYQPALGLDLGLEIRLSSEQRAIHCHHVSSYADIILQAFLAISLCTLYLHHTTLLDGTHHMYHKFWPTNFSIYIYMYIIYCIVCIWFSQRRKI